MKIATVTVLTLVALAGVAAANVDGPHYTTTPVSYTLTNWTNSLAFPKFDSSLGTLTEVDLWLSGSLRTTLTVTNNSPESSTGHANTHEVLSVSDPQSLLGQPTIDLLSPGYFYNLNGGEQTTSGELTKNGTFFNAYVDQPTLDEFTGAGSLYLSAWTFTETALFNTGGNTDASQVTDASLTGRVTYYYDATPPVPEPVTMTLLGLGLAGLGGYIRRRKTA